jgi:hypothetical protein
MLDGGLGAFNSLVVKNEAQNKIFFGRVTPCTVEARKEIL